MKNKKLWTAVRLILGIAAITLIIISMFDDRSNACLAGGLGPIAIANVINCADRKKKGCCFLKDQ